MVLIDNITTVYSPITSMAVTSDNVFIIAGVCLIFGFHIILL